MLITKNTLKQKIFPDKLPNQNLKCLTIPTHSVGKCPMSDCYFEFVADITYCKVVFGKCKFF